jgi:hypothetical protein
MNMRTRAATAGSWRSKRLRKMTFQEHRSNPLEASRVQAKGGLLWRRY